MKQAVILAGGKGTRLRERLGDLPKPLIDVCGVPLLERQVLLLKRYGFERVEVLVNYRAEAIERFCAERNHWGLQVRCVDDGEPRGTAGAVLKILDTLDEEFLVVYGDTMLQVDLERFARFHAQAPDAAATLFVHPNDHPQDSDLVEVDASGNVRGFHPYPHPPGAWLPNLVNAALYCVKREALRPWQAHVGMLDFGKDLFPAMIARGLQLRAYNSPEYIKDVGTPARIDKVSADLRSGRIERAGLDHAQRAVFVDRDGTLNREVDHLCRAEQFELLPGVEAAVRRLNRAEYRVCVVTNQPVLARGECSEAELRRIHNKMETLLGAAGAFVDRIDYCPHHPDKGFDGEVAELKVACDCRKPATGLIDTAAAALNVARERSWLVGDSSADMLAAQRAGVRSILVETGYAGLDHKHPVTPDYVMPDFAAAVSFILDGHARLLEALRVPAQGIERGALVFIGGHARSGKSLAASALAEVLREGGHRCHVLSTDRWLRSEIDRQPGVAGRHDLDALRALLRRLQARGEPLHEQLPAYLKARRLQLANAQEVTIEPDDTVIVEGVMALPLGAELAAVHRFAVRTDEDLRRARMLREYALRGEADAAEALYAARMADEWPAVQAGLQGALSIELPDLNNEEVNA